LIGGERQHKNETLNLSLLQAAVWPAPHIFGFPLQPVPRSSSPPKPSQLSFSFLLPAPSFFFLLSRPTTVLPSLGRLSSSSQQTTAARPTRQPPLFSSAAASLSSFLLNQQPARRTPAESHRQWPTDPAPQGNASLLLHTEALRHRRIRPRPPRSASTSLAIGRRSRCKSKRDPRTTAAAPPHNSRPQQLLLRSPCPATDPPSASSAARSRGEGDEIHSSRPERDRSRRRTREQI